MSTQNRPERRQLLIESLTRLAPVAALLFTLMYAVVAGLSTTILIAVLASLTPVLLLSYLQPRSAEKKRYETAQLDMLHELRVQHANLTHRLNALSSRISDSGAATEPLTDDERKALLEDLHKSLVSTASSDMMQDLRKAVREELSIEDVRDRMTNTIRRLVGETEALAQRANINLVIGICTALLGLAILAYIVFSDHSGIATAPLSTYATSIFPRISLVVFVEIFAYFFLRLYKAGLTEIKYFHNELTNVELKCLGLMASRSTSDASTIQGAVKALYQTERNFVLSKGQTTVDLECARIDSSRNADLLSTISQAIKALAADKK